MAVTQANFLVFLAFVSDQAHVTGVCRLTAAPQDSRLLPLIDLPTHEHTPTVTTLSRAPPLNKESS